jgi:hypothetical protein
MMHSSTKLAWTRPIIVLALPGAGKSYLTANYPDKFVDTDTLIRHYFGSVNAENADLALDLPEFQAELKAQNKTRSVLTNLHIPWLEPDVSYGYGGGYLRHLAYYAKRQDLLDEFTSDELEAWAIAASKYKKHVELQPHEFLSDVITFENTAFPITSV